MSIQSRFITGLLAVVSICWGQNIQIDSNQNPVDGSKSLILSVYASEPYQIHDGGRATFRPALSLQCRQVGSKRHLDITLRTAGVRSQYVQGRTLFMRNPRVSNIKIRLDNQQPKRTQQWSVLDDFASLIGPSNLISGLLKAKIAYIQFEPSGANRRIVSEFNVSGLTAEFAKHEECVAK